MKFKSLKVLLLIVVIILFLVATILLFPMFKELTTEVGRATFKAKIETLGIGGYGLVSGLVGLQVLVAFLPGEPLEILAGMCFGTIKGSLVIFGSVFVSSAFIFFMVKKYGKTFIQSFMKQESIEKIENSKWLKNTKNIYMVLFILFFIPGTPKDLLVYLAGLLPIKAVPFLMLSTFARFPSVISSTMIGSHITGGSTKMIIIISIVTLAFSLFGIWIFAKKNKRIKE